MTMTDPVADMLTRIRNANQAMHEGVVMPSSKQKIALADLLKEEGYIADFDVSASEKSTGDVLSITMKYTDSRERVISGLRRVSKPGLRVYTKSDKIPRVLGGLGVAVVSTSKGLMSDREARRRLVEEEGLCRESEKSQFLSQVMYRFLLKVEMLEFQVQKDLWI